MASAGTTLVGLFGLAQELNVEAEGIDIGPSPTDAALAANFSLPIEDMDLTVRSYNCLKREGVHTVGELVTRSEADLLDIRNFGAKSIDEVKIKLHVHGPRAQGQPARLRPEPGRDRRSTPTSTGALHRRRGRRRRLPGDRAALSRTSTARAPAVTDGGEPFGPPHADGGAPTEALASRSEDRRARCPPPPRAPASAAAPRTSG